MRRGCVVGAADAMLPSQTGRTGVGGRYKRQFEAERGFLGSLGSY